VRRRTTWKKVELESSENNSSEGRKMTKNGEEGREKDGEMERYGLKDRALGRGKWLNVQDMWWSVS
jgi:hypothetical protein